MAVAGLLFIFEACLRTRMGAVCIKHIQSCSCIYVNILRKYIRDWVPLRDAERRTQRGLINSMVGGQRRQWATV